MRPNKKVRVKFPKEEVRQSLRDILCIFIAENGLIVKVSLGKYQILRIKMGGRT
jgi:hypothetical protein